MTSLFTSLSQINKDKIDYLKGLRQGLLMIIPAFIGYFMGYFSLGILVATGTLSHIYVFKGAAKSMIRTVIVCSLSFTTCMMLGTLTVIQPVLYGLLLLIVTVIPYYMFNALKIAGPSSTFFIVTFALSSNLPVDPASFWVRGLAMLVGGLLATIVVLITICLTKEKPEDQAIKADFQMIQHLMHHYDNPDAFKQATQSAVATFNNSDKLLITSAANHHDKYSARFQKLLLLHTTAQGIYSELLELHENQVRPLPQDLIQMVEMIVHNATSKGEKQQLWSKTVDIDNTFDNLEQHILKIDALVHAQDTQLEHEDKVRQPLYSKRIIQNLTLDSFVFKNTCIYALVMAVAIFVALAFNIQKSYWIVISAHTVMLGMTTVRMFDRAFARGIGTILGALLLSGILYFHPHTMIAVILMGAAAAMTEAFVGANYAFAVIFITTQVILLNGLASGNLSMEIAYTRILDVIIGITIAIVGILILNRKTASSMLPHTIAEVVRKEASVFHYLFSANYYDNDAYTRTESVDLSVKMSNMIQVYQSASGEIFSNREVINYYYPSIYALEEINFMLMRAMADHQRYTISDTQLGEYLVTFENIAKHFDIQSQLTLNTLSDLPQYNYIKSALMKLQNNCLAERKDISDAEDGSATQQG
ncbi:FUSC family protein [Staphylococcus lugdunensis]|uniref:FUSC family protein n=1 Tax=Staphylococcus lugdunensis TaxID=28035 RepID=UPI001F4C7766|nr:FUSC family protein [Staphylococcus lugdunensis]